MFFSILHTRIFNSRPAENLVKNILLLIVFSAITVAAYAQAPANDNPCNAIALTPDANCNFQTFSNANATATTGAIAAPGCANYLGGDVWFKAVVPAGGALTFDTQAGGITDGGMAIYRGNSCFALVLLQCDDNSGTGNMPKITVTGLVAGSTVYARVWENGNDNNGTFGICVTVPVPAPVNDNPCSAIELTPGATCSYQTYTNASATATPNQIDPGCAGYQGGDVWFKVIVPPLGALIFDTQAGVVTDGGMALYRGDACNTVLTLISCDDNSSSNTNMPKLIAGSLNPGDTVFVRVWENGNDNNGTFGICVTLPPPPPVNDGPCTAIELPVGATCSYTVYSNENATATAGPPAPGCASYDGGDVWFKVVVPAGGALTIDTDDGVVTDGGMALYSGTCNTLTLIACDDDASSNGNMPKISAGGLTPGDTLLVRFWEANNDNNGTFGICATIPPPAPVNDDPCNAVELIPATTCTFQDFTNENAIGTSGVPAPGCGGYAGGDVWFRSIVPAGGALTFRTQANVITDGGMAIYKGTCDNLALIVCNDDGPDNNMPVITAGGLNPGDTIWIRFWEFNNDNNGTFKICVSIPPPAPDNDSPCGAILLAVDTICTYQQFTNESATGTTGVTAPGCAGYSGGDVWFKAVVPASGSIVFDTDEGIMTDGGMALYSGSCGALTLVSCDDNSSSNGNMPKLTIAGRTPGDTIWIRMWENGNNNNGTFGICAKVPPPPPANDDPCTSVELPVNATCAYQYFTNESASASAGVPAPGCAGYSGGDVWFRAIVPAGGAIRFDTDDSTMVDGGMAVYRGNCNALALIACDDNSGIGNMPKLTLGNLTPGDTLWVRIWENGNNENGIFGICASTPPPPPVNDEPCRAISLTPDSTCTYQTFTNENATSTLNVPAPGCASYSGADVWFSVVVPSGGALIFDSQTGVITDGGMAVYSGTCGNLSLIDCDDDGSDNGNMPSITVGGLIPGDTIWVRFWEFLGDNNGTFGICVKLPPPGPVNDAPCGAIELPVSDTCNYQIFTTENSFGTASVPDPGCGGYQGGDVWFKAIVPAGGALTFDTQEGDLDDGAMAVYTGRCDSLTLVQCNDDAGAGLMPKLTIGGLTPGDTVWVRFWENGNFDFGTFGICVTIPPPPPANDDPCGAIVLTASDVCTYQTFTNASAYGTASVPVPGCANYQGSDVWFKTVVPPLGALTFDSQSGVVTDGGMAVYKGRCDSLTLLECDDNDGSGNMPKMTLGGLVPGDTLWIRFWENGNDNNGTFGICVTIPPPPPANDDPCGAISLTATDSCIYQNFTNESSYSTASVPDPGCGDYQGADVWFKITAPAAGALNINTLAGTIIDGAMAIYRADSCSGTMQLIACDDNASTNPDMPYITATGLTPGSTIWIRVWSNGGVLNTGTFGICATIPPLQPATFSFACARDTSFNCGGGDTCFTLTAIIPDIHALTDRYAINPLSAAGCFNPYADPGNEGPSTDLITDDVYSAVINLPFTFPFFGTNYNSLVASTNGFISFDITNTLLFSHWNIINNGAPQDLPSDFYDRALIMGPYHDLDPQHHPNPGQRVKYNITGQAPNRRWILSFFEVPLYTNFDGGCDTLVHNTHQIVLYEGTGVVEVFLFDMQNCLGWNEGRAMVGMQDFSQTKAIMAPGRKASDAPWGRIGMNESWRFVPIGGPTLFKRVELFDTSGNFLATGDTTFLDSASLKVNFRNLCSLNRLPAGLNTLLVRAVYRKFDDPAQEEIGADTVRIFIPNLKVNFDVTQAQCSGTGGAVTIHTLSGLPPLRFSSDSGRTWVSDSVFNTLDTGVYYFRIQDNAGCARDTIITLSAQPGPMQADFIVTNPLCNGGNGTVVITPSGGVRPYRFSSDGGITYQYGDSIFSLKAGTYNFHVADTVQCTKDTVITITQPDSLMAVYSVTDVKCNGGADGLIRVMASGGTPAYSYSFDNGTYGSSDSSLVNAGSHIVSIRDNNGCTKDTTIIIDQPALLAAVYTVIPPLCNGDNSGSIIVSASGGTTGYSYSKDSGLTYQLSDTFPSLSGGTYNIRIQDANRCIKDTAIVVSQPEQLTVSAVPGNATCDPLSTGQITATGTGGTGTYNYSIDNGINYQPDNIFIRPQGTYTITIKDSSGCTAAAAPATIGFTFDLTLQGRADTSICGNVSVRLNTISNAQTFSWTQTPGSSLDNTSSASPLASPTVTTDYFLTAQTGNCILKDTVHIEVVPAPTVFAGDTIAIVIGADAHLSGSVTNAASYIWSPATYLNNPNSLTAVSVMPQETITYTLTALNSLGCSASDEVLIKVNRLCTNIKNAFTPNGDGVNDTWLVYDQFDCLSNVRVQIFNRYGSKVYESTNYRNQWTGTYNGQSLPDATYYYVIDYLFTDGRAQQVRGDVTILR